MIKTDFFAFYGSLRVGMANYELYKSSLEYISRHTIKGYALYALEDYPYAVKTNSPDDEIVVELFRVTEQQVKRSIHDLELGAGYIFELIPLGGHVACLYLFEHAGNNHRVKSGDWVEFYGVSG